MDSSVTLHVLKYVIMTMHDVVYMLILLLDLWFQCVSGSRVSSSW